MKKILATLLVTAMMLGNVAVLTVPNRAQAFLGFGDLVLDVPHTALTAKEVIVEIGKATLKRLANKVLNKMVKKTVNWALTGFGPYEESAGQPFYVQNQESLMKNIEDQQLVKTIQELGDGCENGECPYAKDLARSLVKSNMNGGKSEAKFDLDKYSSNWQAFTQEGKFSEGGGWKTWEGMFNNPQNSAFGAFLTTTIKTETKKQEATTTQEKELTRNDGFLSMRKCVTYANGKAPTSEIDFSKFKSKSKKENPETITPDLLPGQGGAIDITGVPGSGGAAGNPVLQQAEEYSSTKQYTQGNKVSYGLNVFEALKDAKGNPPPLTSTNNTYWKFIQKSSTGQTVGNVGDYFDDTYALPGLEVDNCIRYEVTTPGAMAKEMLGKTLTTSIDKATLDSTTGNSIVDSLVDMAAVFITNGLDKMITKATTGDQKVFAGGIGDPNATYLGVGNGSNTNSAYYSDDGKNPVEIQDPHNPTKLHPDLLRGIDLTKQEIAELEILLANLRKQPEQYKDLDMCLPGPDLNWEKRLQDEFKKSATRLERKSGKDNKKGDLAQEAIARLETYKESQISQTKLSMLSIIPSSISILSKMSQVQSLSSELTSNEKKYSQRVGALATLEAIEKTLAAGELDNVSIVTLKKQYAGIQRGVSTEESLEDTVGDKEAAISDVDINFNRQNSKSLISKCIEQRKSVDPIIIREDVGETLFCNWQTHNTVSNRTKSNGERFLLQTNPFTGGVLGWALGFNKNKVVEESIPIPTPYDTGLIWPLIGDLYTQDEEPFDSKGKDGEFAVDCNKYYVAPISYYLDQK